MKRRTILKAIGAGPLALGLPNARGETYPGRPIQVMMPFTAGNTLDICLRQAGEPFRVQTGQPIVPVAKPGGAGIIAAMSVKSAQPDGYTLLLCNTTMFAINPHTFASLPYDPFKDFRPVTNMLGGAMVLAVSSNVPAKSLGEFIAWTKANPGKVTFASFLAGSSAHFAGVILNDRAGIDMLHVGYNGTPQTVTALLADTVNAAFVPIMAVKQHVESGRVKALAITSPHRSSHFPDLPTFRELGFPDLEIYIWTGLAAPAKTPDAVVAKVNAEFTQILNRQDIKDLWNGIGWEPLPSTPEAFESFYRAESKRWAEAVKLSGFRQKPG